MYKHIYTKQRPIDVFGISLSSAVLLELITCYDLFLREKDQIEMIYQFFQLVFGQSRDNKVNLQ